ncbi:MAG TPA: hypothetical protein VFT74_10040, partial [Isosphaeraceae bacterium]|nr:hypothetical protein [Isosphaeraceae bacterium]
MSKVRFWILGWILGSIPTICPAESETAPRSNLANVLADDLGSSDRGCRGDGLNAAEDYQALNPLDGKVAFLQVETDEPAASAPEPKPSAARPAMLTPWGEKVTRDN